MDKIKKLEGLEGKRNTFLTIFFPPDANFKKHIESLYRTARALKHKNKRHQLLLVLNVISDKNNDINIVGEAYENGLIICSGLNNQMVVLYYDFQSPNIIKSYEYYYDYRFNTKRIIELFCEDVVVKLDDTNIKNLINKLKKDIELDEELLVIGEKEVTKALELEVLHKLYYFNEDVPYELINKMRKINGKVFVLNNEHANLLRDFDQMVGYLRYPVDI